MMDKTGGKEVVDPTGRASHINASTVTVMKDWGFGLGRASDIVLDTMKQKHPDVKVDERFVPKMPQFVERYCHI